MSSSPSVAPCATGPELKETSAQDTLVVPKITSSTVSGNPKGEVKKADNHRGGATRDQRRRLKKLRKRAARFCPQTDLSGISKREEWEEAKTTRQLIALNPDQAQDNDKDDEDYAPHVGLRQTKKHLQERDKKRDGFDHRYTLKYLVFSSLPPNNEKPNGKRPREETPRTIPSWICLHNPVCVDHVAVLEVHLTGNRLNREEVEANLETTLGAPNAYPTKWFEGPKPQSISDVLLYEKPPQPPRKKAKPSDISSEKHRMEELKSFVLSQEDLKKEGYPMAESEGIKEPTATTTISKEFRKPTSFSLEDAKAIVESTHAKVENQKHHFVQTLASDEEHKPRVFGLDCEMVQTGDGTELGRITLIEYNPTTTTSKSKDSSFQDNYKVLMDELVLPYPPILDYVTAYSGITAALLKDVATRLEQIQASLLTYVHPNDIVVGHSLENDLMATRWIHPTVIDTAVLFRTNDSFKYSLKHLSNILLRKRIQGGASHCSEEDAAATLELAIRRAQEGPSFVIHPKDKQWWLPSTSESATVFIGPSTWITDHVTRQPSAIHALTCDDMAHPNTKAIISWLTGPKRRAGLVWANLCVSTPEHLKLLEKLVVDLKTKLSTNAVLMVNIQRGYAHAADTSRRRAACRNPKTTVSWSEEDEKHCRSLVEDCREGKVFWVTKHPGPGGRNSKVEGSNGAEQNEAAK